MGELILVHVVRFAGMEKSCATMDHGHPPAACCGFKMKDNDAEEVTYLLLGSHTHRHWGNSRTRRIEGVVARGDSAQPGDRELIIQTWRGLQRRFRQ